MSAPDRRAMLGRADSTLRRRRALLGVARSGVFGRASRPCRAGAPRS
jgi:hypothetical protein